MRSFTLFILALLLGAGARAQTVATFDTLSLPGSDTFYVNYSSYGSDVGFDDGLAYFPCVYDTFSGGFEYWRNGFVYTNKTDSLTPGYTNQYSAITSGGYDNSSKYIIAFDTTNKILLKGDAAGQPVNGFYIANTAYAYYSMRDGDFVAKKFGGTTGNDPDFFKLTIRGYDNGLLKADSVEVYLADFRDPNNTNDTIYRGWRWVNLLPLGNVDSLKLNLTSTDVGAFGINTPLYYAIDHFMTYETASVSALPEAFAAKVYPNPAVSELHVELTDEKVKQLQITDALGRLVSTYEVKDRLTSLPVATLPAGTYILNLEGDGQKATVRFVKQ